MKKILFFLLLLAATSTQAQDVIVKRDGSTILSKVIEITTTEVKYKRFSNQNGPTYTISKAELQAINYENGEKETFDGAQTTNTGVSGHVGPVTDADLLRMVDQEKQKPVKVKTEEDKLRLKVKRLKLAGWITGSAMAAGGIALFFYGLANDDGEPFTYHKGNIGGGAQFTIPGLICFAGGVATTTACLIRAHNIKKNAGLALQSAPVFQHDFAFSNGTTLSTSIDMLKDSRLKSQTLGIGLRYSF